jgi:hypothetical protein
MSASPGWATRSGYRHGMAHRAACGHWREDKTLAGLRSQRVPAPHAVHAVAEGAKRTVCRAYEMTELTDLGPWADWPRGTRCLVCHDLASEG